MFIVSKTNDFTAKMIDSLSTDWAVMVFAARSQFAGFLSSLGFVSDLFFFSLS